MAPTANRTPVYQQIADHIRALIASGELKEGDVVPSITAAWGVSPHTATRALNELRDFVMIRPGLLTIVAKSRTVPADVQVAEALHVLPGDPVRMQVAGNTALFTHVLG